MWQLGADDVEDLALSARTRRLGRRREHAGRLVAIAPAPRADRVRQQFAGIKLLSCLSCSAELDVRFELHGAEPVIRPMAADEPAFSGGEHASAR